MPIHGLTTPRLITPGTLGGPLAAGGSLLLDTYTGAEAAYSFRKLRTAYSGDAVRIRESGGDTEADIGFDGNGDFDTATAASHIGANTGYIVTWYDQSGNGNDVTQGTDAQQPLYEASGLNSLPNVMFDASADTYLLNSTLSLTGATASCFVVSMLLSGSDAFAGIVSMSLNSSTDWNTTTGWQTLDCIDQDFRSYHNGTGGAVSVTNNTARRMAAFLDGSSNLTIYRDGSAQSSVSPSGDPSLSIDRLVLGGRWVSGAVSTGNFSESKLSEVLIYNSDQTSNVSGIDTDQSTYWGF